MPGSIQRTRENAAFAPRTGYINLPALGGIDVATGGNMAVSSFLYPRNGQLLTLFDKNISAQTALGKLKPENLLNLDARIELLGFGFYSGKERKDFWSFGLSTHIDTEVCLPYELFEFVKKGESHARIRNISVTEQSYAEAAVGYSRELKEGIYVGGRVKFLVGASRARMAIDRLDVDLDGSLWSVSGSGSLTMSGAQMLQEKVRQSDGTRYYDFKDTKFDYAGPKSYGVGLDLGASWDVIENLQVSAAVNDLGFISWNAQESIAGEMSKSESFGGVNIVDGQQVGNPKFDFGNLEFDKKQSDGYTRSLYTSINLGGEYKLWERRVGLGLLYNVKMLENAAAHNVMASATFTPVKSLTVGTNYWFFNGRGNSLGFSVNYCPRVGVNLFASTDWFFMKHTPEFVPVDATSVTASFGIGIPFGKPGARK